MRALGALLLGITGAAAGPFVNLLIDRVPLRLPLRPLGAWPRRCPAVDLPPLPPYPGDEDDDEDEASVEASLEASEEADPMVELEESEPDLEPEPAPGPAQVLIPYEEVGDHGARAAGVPLGRPRCPACGRRCSLRYPAVDLLLGLLFAGAALRFGADWVLPAYLVLFVCLVAVSAVDLDYHIIPNRIVYPTIFASVPLLALAAVVGHDGQGLREAFIGGAAAWVVFLVIHLIMPAGMGFGDVRLSFILGLFLGWLTPAHVITGLFMGFVLGAVIGIALIVVHVKGRREAIPFGPFLAAGAALVIFAGDPLIDGWLGALAP